MTDKINTQLIIQVSILTLLILNVSISFTAFDFLQGCSYLVWGLCCISFLGLSVLFIKKPYITYLDACVLTYLIVIIVSTFINGTDLKTALYRSIELILLMLILNIQHIVVFI